MEGTAGRPLRPLDRRLRRPLDRRLHHRARRGGGAGRAGRLPPPARGGRGGPRPAGLRIPDAPAGRPHPILLDQLHVRPGHLGGGIGGALLRRSFAWAAARHPGRDVYLEVLRENAPAIAFYTRQGGRRTAEGTWHHPAGFAVEELVYTWRAAEVRARAAMEVGSER
ncbi:GNAT family N-acetyltransferase [Allostreptomyces psammosilenae]|uniref:GNAT family N-acetyltransferase n=1 Tax=Allostreptomyces psammosilenae TaxID=1892865 RepID=UPI001C544759|nr:GNAT family N-acetyltransferase [Allostreptomyces psammosilenae]